MKKVSSLQNPLIKNVLKLEDKSRERKKQGLCIVEGKREIELAVKGGYKITTLLFLSDRTDSEYLSGFSEAAHIEVSQQVYEKIAYRGSTEGLIAIVEVKDLTLENLQFKNKNPLILIAEAVEKPGNIGAMIRTADAANIDVVILADPKTDVYNPNVVRSSVGGVFTTQIATGSSEKIISYLKERYIHIYTATLQNSNHYTSENYTESTALVVGSEDKGLSKLWKDNATQNINIPMLGFIDSMNVSVAAAILIFEAKRQRNN